MTELVRMIALILGVLLALLAIVLVLAVWLRTTAIRRRAPHVAAAAAALRSAALGTGQTDAAAVALGRLPLSARIELIEEMGRDLHGVERARVAEVAGALGLIARAQAWCGDRRWWVRIRAVRFLALTAGGDLAVPPLLEDPHVLVRAEAAYWVGETGHAGSAMALVRMAVREGGLPLFASQDALIRLGPAGAAALAAGIDRTTEPPQELLRVAAMAAFPAIAGAVLRLAADESCPHRDLAVAALAAVGGPGAGRVLAGALDDPRAPVRAAAASGLGRTGEWEVAPRLARAVQDPSWDVRRAAALGLRGLGPAGLLYLRALTSGSDRFAADMARHVLAFREESA